MKSQYNLAGVFSGSHLLLSALAVSILAGSLSGCSAKSKASRHLSRADEYYKAGEFEKAKIEYTNVLKVDGRNPAAMRQLGLIWAEQGSLLRALPILSRARESEPSNAEVRTKLAYVLGSLKQVDEGRKEAAAALARSPGNYEALLFLLETARTEEEVAGVQQMLLSSGKASPTLEHLAKAHLALLKRDLDASESELKKAVEADPKSAVSHSTLANMHLRRGKVDDAGDEFKVAANLAPIRSPIRLRYAEFLSQTGKPDEAEAWLEMVTRSAADFLPAWNLRAENALAKKEYEKAQAHLQQVFRCDGTNFEARLIEGRLYLAKGDAKKAVELLGNLNNTYPGVPPAKYHLARAYLKAGDTKQANAVLNQAIAADPNYVEAILLRAELDLRAGNAQEVIHSMIALLKKQPDLPQADMLLAAGYQSTGQLVEAVAVAQEMTRKAPKNPRPQWLLALLLRLQGNTDEARRAFEKVQTMTPESLLPVSQLVAMDVADYDFIGALRRVDERLKKEPDSAGAHYLKGRIFAEQRDWEHAESELKRAIELDPAQSNAYQVLSNVYVSSGKVPKAIEQLSDLLSKTPDNVQALMVSGLLYGRMKMPEKARDAYQRLLAKQPDFTPALNNLAWIYAEDFNDLAKARDLVRRARSLRPEDPAIADTLGWILYKSGDYQQALAVLREAAGELEDNPEVSYHVGMASYVMGDEEAARKALWKAAASRTEFSGKDEAKMRLALLDGTAEGKFKLPIEKLQDFVRVNPRDTIAWVRLAEALEENGSSKEAAAAYEKAIAVNPRLLSAVVKAAELNAAPPKNSESALKFVKAAKVLAPNDPVIAGRLGLIAFDAGDFGFAYSLLQQGISGNLADPVVLHRFAWAAYSVGKVQEARDTMERFQKVASDHSMAEDGRCFLRLTSLEDGGSTISADEIDDLLKGKPGYVPALMVRGNASARHGDRNTAIGAYTEILRQFPKFAPAQKELAILYLQSPDTREKAHELALAAQRTLPDDAELMKALGESSYHRKEFGTAVRLLESSGKRVPLDAQDLFYLGMGQRQIRGAAAGRDSLERAIAAGLKEPMLAEAKRVLSEKPVANK